MRVGRYTHKVANDSLPSPYDRDPLLGRMVVNEATLKARISEIGTKLSADYEGKQPLLVGVLKGAFVFMADLIRAVTVPCDVDFMAVSSYGTATKTSGVVRILKDLDTDITGRHVIIVEDIVDSGLTLAWLRRNLMSRGAASLEVCALFVKEGLQQQDPNLRYEGFRLNPEFIIGYGLDVAEQYRHLPFVCVYNQEA